jgi:hypothetical protein
MRISLCASVVFDKRDGVQENRSTVVSEKNKPAYLELVTSMGLLTSGPNICPTSIIVPNSPIAPPTTWMETSSLTGVGVEDVRY